MEQMKFLIKLESMIGVREGIICLYPEGDRLNADFTFPGNAAHAAGTMTDAGEIHLSGSFQTFFRKFEFTAEGTLKRDILRLELKTNGKIYRLEGRKIQDEKTV